MKTANTSVKNRAAVIIVIAAIAAIPFFMGKYFEFNSPCPFDGSSNVYSAKHILDGARIGIDEIPGAAPGTLLVNMLGVWLFGFSDTGPKVIQMIFQASALIIMFLTMRKVFGILPAALAVIIASIYLSSPLIAKVGNVKEQYMIAFMVIAVCFFILSELNRKPSFLFLAGAFAGWAPLFKQTAASAILAIALFILFEIIKKQKTLKQASADIFFITAGALCALAPVFLWLKLSSAPLSYWPYSFIWETLLSSQNLSSDKSYITGSWSLTAFPQQAARVFRYYRLLILPISLASASIITYILRLTIKPKTPHRQQPLKNHSRFIPLLAAWWLFDMAFVWISPRSYEQYYLPLNASAAMLSGHAVAVYRDSFSASIFHKAFWVTSAFAALIVMTAMVWHIFFGITASPHSATPYGQKKHGYIQSMTEISLRKQHALIGAWEQAADYIRLNSEQNDKIYVWGWYPGIYVKAQRMSPSPSAFTSEMHVMSPQNLKLLVESILIAFEKNLPKFIVDSRKIDFPWDRPPLELWPITANGFLNPDTDSLEKYDQTYAKMLAEKIGPDEALRYDAMKPFRQFVMKYYRIERTFGTHVLLKLKNSASN